MYSQTIFKKDSKGKLRYLTMSADGDSLIDTSGRIDTTKPLIHSRIVKGKNIGRSNETTGAQQAEKEAKAKIIKKLSVNYFSTESEAFMIEVILPMLAEESKKAIIPWETGELIYTNPKLDGIRMTATIKNHKVTLKSRENVDLMDRYGTVQHIIDELAPLDDCILDGELYVHGYDFEDCMKAIKKFRATAEDGIPATKELSFNVYDIINDKTQNERYGDIYKLLNGKSYQHIELVEYTLIGTLKDLQEMHELYLAAGYEGTIIRLGNGLYKINGRSKDLIKWKDFIDIACKIISIGPAKKRATWGRPVVEWLKDDGSVIQFPCATKMSHKNREDLLINAADYIGKTAEVRYFEEFKSGTPRFPVMVGIRLDK